ncbi:hypothetical protein HRJ35_15005 [Shewanella oneidensis MR-1]|uniref:Mu phage uncharacterized protein n=1 Tax=Shewanella oneidensis (strain ATCC 700550 / JCM 31522 / CIP 106686 / LMG 19005 / NCIMB 14063 / MR-1) TaxID=211586 RepID=Q8EDQ6_SHEON|nr:phage protein [Shewanella oneidensis]AAN55715.1 Mu phage uncharacterized protein [Shewanella oneidensis MR-1]MDX5995643.1 hypothetical protein [Shewanella oneidensis]MEE2026306.1 hypothetical protein [Shewanella oneidensis]QKG97190.1 hypothetical protein HRJ35_15005 [Shewanella oneidensis MR-1]
MFFKGAPLISQSASPLPVDSLLMRSSYVSSGTTLKQTLAASNVPQTILFNKLSLPSPDLIVDLVTGEVTAVKDYVGMASLNCIVIRESGSGSDALWGVFVEVFDSASGTWVKAQDSLRELTLSRDIEDEVRPIDYTLAVSFQAGAKFRWRHYTSDASRQVSLIAKAATAVLPGAAAAIMSFWGVKP